MSLKDCVDYKEGKELLQTYTYFPMAIEGEDLEAMPKFISSFLSGAVIGPLPWLRVGKG